MIPLQKPRPLLFPKNLESMQAHKVNKQRRKIVKWSLWITAAFATVGIGIGKKPKSNKTAKLLTQDGKLVAIDQALLDKLKTGEKISKTGLQQWVNR